MDHMFFKAIIYIVSLTCQFILLFGIPSQFVSNEVRIKNTLNTFVNFNYLG